MPRQRALSIIDMTQAIQFALSEKGIPDHVYAQAGVSEKERSRIADRLWKEKAFSRLDKVK